MSLALHGVTKSYPGVTALDSVNCQFERGSVHALVGENGAGKSTLLRVIAGATTPDSGSLRLDDVPIRLQSPRDALLHGVTVIYQELTLVPHLSVAANIFLGMEPTSVAVLDEKTMFGKSREALECLGANIDPHGAAGHLSIAQQQLVELARALVRNARVIAFDEPTATLTPHEVQHLFHQIDRLQVSGTAIIFVSHRLDEIRRISDTITVLRDGQLVSTGATSAVTDNEIVRQMVGREVEYERQPAERLPDSEPALVVRQLERLPAFQQVSFSLRAGEILGLAGLVGAGRSEVARVIAGIDRATAGAIELHREPFAPRTPRDAIRRGVVYFPEDRKRYGLLPDLPVRANVSLSSLARYARFGVIQSRAELVAVGRSIRDVDLRPPDPERLPATLSGGNQQKVVFAKGLLAEAEVLLFDEPTRGVDVAAKVELHKQIRRLANAGKAILVISSELPELMALADRIMVLREGRVAGELTGADMSPERIMKLAVAA